VNYRERIRGTYDQLSAGYRRIADFLLAHYQEAAFMTAAEVARSVQVDTALVVRFAQRLGYPGYPELINDVQEHVKEDLQAIYVPPAGMNTPEAVFRSALLQDRNNLEYMLLHLDDAVVNDAVLRLKAARRIFVAGEGNTSFLAQMFAMRLVVLGLPAHTVSCELAGQAAIMSTLKPADVLVGIGSTAMTPGVAVLLRMARDLGCITIGVAGSLTNPVATTAELVIAAPANTSGLLPSWTCMAAVMHGLSQAVALQLDHNAADWATRTSMFIGEYADVLAHQLTSVRRTIESYNSSPEKKTDADVPAMF